MNNLTKKYKSDFSFSSKLMKWYDLNKRNLPWRSTQNPYFIWLSEIILQQTRVDQGMPYYLKFVKTFPQIEDLARASEDEVLKLWQGLGYYSRARNLHAAAKYIVSECNGQFPTEYKEVLKLKGVGDYTAAAIMSFAYNKVYATVDGNVFRVLSRVFGVDEYIDTGVGKKIFIILANELIDQELPSVYNQAIMDFGSLQCVPKSPDCERCPFSDQCFAYNKGLVEVLPQKKGKVAARDRFFNYLDVRVGDTAFLKRREGSDIWKGLYEFPLIETEHKMTFEELMKLEAYQRLLKKAEHVQLTKSKECKHVLSHQVIYASFYRLEVDLFDDSEYLKVEAADLDEYGVSRLTEKYLLEG